MSLSGKDLLLRENNVPTITREDTAVDGLDGSTVTQLGHQLARVQVVDENRTLAATDAYKRFIQANAQREIRRNAWSLFCGFT